MPIATSEPVAAADASDLTPASIARAFAMDLLDDAYGAQTVPPGGSANWWRGGFFAPLADLGLLSVSGEDAAKFLHGQLTNDVEHLPEAQARWYGYCTAKGRMLGAFLGWRDQEAIRLLTASPSLEPLRKRISMFVLRSKVKVLDSSPRFAVIGLGGGAALPALASLGLAAPAPMNSAAADDLTAIGLPSVAMEGVEVRRWLLVVPAGALERVAGSLRTSLAPIGSAAWRWTDVLAGVARIVPATSELFVPQMVNFELVGGVSFTKGCYPGQEVVARSHYLGKLKRRMFIGHLPADPPPPGADVFDLAGGEACGQVVMAAPSPFGGADLLFECKTASAQAGGLRVADSPIELSKLPYALPG
ncbi:MAG: folate-binding protein [Burkholderiaceae bacterium]|nr:folate-binding protein [Burkholderiaceae bacterium]